MLDYDVVEEFVETIRSILCEMKLEIADLPHFPLTDSSGNLDINRSNSNENN